MKISLTYSGINIIFNIIFNFLWLISFLFPEKINRENKLITEKKVPGLFPSITM